MESDGGCSGPAAEVVEDGSRSDQNILHGAGERGELPQRRGLRRQINKISHIDMGDGRIDKSSPVSLAHIHIDIHDDHIDMVDNHVDIPYPISITHIPYQYPYRYIIDVRSLQDGGEE